MKWVYLWSKTYLLLYIIANTGPEHSNQRQSQLRLQKKTTVAYLTEFKGEMRAERKQGENNLDRS